MRRVSVDLRGQAPERFIFSARSRLTAVSLCLLTGKVGVIVEPPEWKCRVSVSCFHYHRWWQPPGEHYLGRFDILIFMVLCACPRARRSGGIPHCCMLRGSC